MRTLLIWLLGCFAAPALGAPGVTGNCANGQCPIAASGPGAGGAAPRELQVDASAIARISNTIGAARAFGTGALVDAEGDFGWIVTCVHLFRDGSGTVQAMFPSGRSFTARVLEVEPEVDLAALEIANPDIAPLAIASDFPQPGEPLVSCGYGGGGRLWCNRGQALGYVSLSGQSAREVLEVSGAARFGDSGGPVLNQNHQLVAVLFGTNGRVVDGTYCGRVRRFLSDLRARLRPRRVAKPVAPPATTAAPSALPAAATNGTAGAEPPCSSDACRRLGEIVTRLNERCQAQDKKFDSQLGAAAGATNTSPAQAADGAAPKAAQPATSAPAREPASPTTSAKPVDPLASAADTLEQTAQPWLSGKLTTILVSLGVPAGVAGVAAGAVVWLAMRGGKARLQAELDRLRSAIGNSAIGNISASPAAATDDANVVALHHNQYVAYETTALDKAWSAAHAHVAEKYPGAVPYLKLVEGVKDQLLSGNSNLANS